MDLGNADEMRTTQPPSALTVEDAARMLGIGRTLAYELIRNDEWPTPVLRMGRLIKIPSGPLTALLRDGHLPEAVA